MLTLMCLAMLVIAASQCFHVFKLYKKVETMEILMHSILSSHLNLIHAYEEANVKKERQKEAEKRPAANRRARTEEERRAASIQRKAWWAKQRAQKASEPSNNQTASSSGA